MSIDLQKTAGEAIPIPSKPLSFKDACQYLQCSKSYLYKLTSRRVVPHFKPLGKKLFFKQEELTSFLFQKPVKTAQEIEQAAINYVALSR